MQHTVVTITLVTGFLVLGLTAAQGQQYSLSDYRSGPAVSPYFAAQENTPAGGQESGSNESEPEWAEELEQEERESPYDEPLETERHDFTQSATVVGHGVWQVEYGFLYTSKSEEDLSERSYATPEILLRYGMSERWEFRSRWNYIWKDIAEEGVIDGMLDPIFSLKYQVSEQKNCRPESALELRLSAPIGSDETSAGRWEPGIDYIYGWKFGPGDYFSLTASTGANANGIGDAAFLDPESNPQDQWWAWSQSVALGAKLTRRTTGYAEWFAILTDGRDEELVLNFINFGVDYLLSNNTVIDIRIGWGLTDDSDDIFAGIGGAVRF